MTVLEDFEFVDARGRKWRVPSGTKVDGASIPQVFWSVIGGPFDGLYREASVIHDYYCDRRNRSWQDVHQVFYDAMITSGVGAKKAYLMFKAVYNFGPRWGLPKIDEKCLGPDGKFDFSKCAENRLPVARSFARPEANKADLMKFIEEVEPGSDPGDIAKLRQAIEATP